MNIPSAAALIAVTIAPIFILANNIDSDEFVKSLGGVGAFLVVVIKAFSGKQSS